MSRSLTIAVDATQLPRGRRGAGRITRSLLEVWKRKSGILSHRIVLVARERHQMAPLQDELGWDFECTWSGAGTRFDVALFPFGRIDWDPGCPRIVMVHDTGCFTDLTSAKPDSERERIRHACKVAERVIVPSEFARRELVANVELGLGKGDILPMGVDPIFSPLEKDPAQRSAFLHENTGGIPYLLFVGSTEPRKNLCGLLDAFNWLSGQIPHRLVLVCRRPRLSITQRLIGKNCPVTDRVRALGNRVIFTEEVPPDRLARLYQHCDLFVMPSWHESFGLPLAEAMACGAPCAAARTSALPEVGGTAVRWFNPEDPVMMAQGILEGLGEAETLRELGPVQAAQFDWERIAHRVLKLLERELEPAVTRSISREEFFKRLSTAG